MQALDYLSQTFARRYATEIGRRYGLLSAAIALGQVAISATTAYAHKSDIIIFLFESQHVTSVVLEPEIILAPFFAGLLSCVIGGIFSLMVSYYAARETAQFNRDTKSGRRAGLIASLIGSATWLGLSVIAAVLTGTDGALIAVDPHSAMSVASQEIGIIVLVALRAIILGGFILLFVPFFSTRGANKGKRLA
jgi:hypothetical protein